jgi:hypothetical protein
MKNLDLSWVTVGWLIGMLLQIAVLPLERALHNPTWWLYQFIGFGTWILILALVKYFISKR